jgi:hypothetical protein
MALLCNGDFHLHDSNNNGNGIHITTTTSHSQIRSLALTPTKALLLMDMAIEIASHASRQFSQSSVHGQVTRTGANNINDNILHRRAL